MRDSSPVRAKPDLSMAAFSSAGGEVEVYPVPAGISPDQPEKLSVVHESSSAHICANIKRV